MSGIERSETIKHQILVLVVILESDPGVNELNGHLRQEVLEFQLGDLLELEDSWLRRQDLLDVTKVSRIGTRVALLDKVLLRALVVKLASEKFVNIPIIFDLKSRAACLLMASSIINVKENVRSFQFPSCCSLGPVTVLLVVLRLNQVLQTGKQSLVFGFTHHLNYNLN